jgi:hypothetical protein
MRVIHKMNYSVLALGLLAGVASFGARADLVVTPQECAAGCNSASECVPLCVKMGMGISCGSTSATPELNACFQQMQTITGSKFALPGWYTFQNYRVIWGGGFLADNSWALDVFQGSNTTWTYQDRIKLNSADVTYATINGQRLYTGFADLEASGIRYKFTVKYDGLTTKRQICVVSPSMGCQDQ